MNGAKGNAKLKAADIRKHQLVAVRSRTLNIEQGLELDGIADVLHFLHNVQPLEGCDYNDDDEFKCGRTAILEWLERRVRAVGDGDSSEVAHG